MHFSNLSDIRAAAAFEAPCIADADTALSNGEFHQRILSAAGLFAEMGIAEGDVIALMLPNQVEFAVAMFAAWRLGAVITPINPQLTIHEATHQIVDSGTKLIVNSNAEAFVTSVQSIPVTALEFGTPYTAEPIVKTDNLALLIYTSGTTGLPKGVMLDHANIEAMSEMGRHSLKIGATDHCLLLLPLFHVNGIIVSILVPLSGGGCVTIRKRFSIDTFFEDIEKIRPSYFSAVPTIYAMLCALPPEIKPDTSSLRYGICGAAPASAELLTKFETRFGFPLIEGYGLSEGTCGSTINPFDGIRKPGTVGLPFVGQEIAIADSNGQHLPKGEMGEVLVKGANVMRGYLGKPAESAKTIVDGWLHTGDIGRIDEDGYLSIVGRLKEMIIRGGENIYPKEIEDVILGFKDTMEAAVIGKPDKIFGEIVVAFVAFRPGIEGNMMALQTHCKDWLTNYKRPAEIIVLETLPKNAMGKIDKMKLKSILASNNL